MPIAPFDSNAFRSTSKTLSGAWGDPSYAQKCEDVTWAATWMRRREPPVPWSDILKFIVTERERMSPDVKCIRRDNEDCHFPAVDKLGDVLKGEDGEPSSRYVDQVGAFGNLFKAQYDLPKHAQSDNSLIDRCFHNGVCPAEVAPFIKDYGLTQADYGQHSLVHHHHFAGDNSIVPLTQVDAMKLVGRSDVDAKLYSATYFLIHHTHPCFINMLLEEAFCWLTLLENDDRAMPAYQLVGMAYAILMHAMPFTKGSATIMHIMVAVALNEERFRDASFDKLAPFKEGLLPDLYAYLLSPSQMAQCFEFLFEGKPNRLILGVDHVGRQLNAHSVSTLSYPSGYTDSICRLTYAKSIMLSRLPISLPTGRSSGEAVDKWIAERATDKASTALLDYREAWYRGEWWGVDRAKLVSDVSGGAGGRGVAGTVRPLGRA